MHIGEVMGRLGYVIEKLCGGPSIHLYACSEDFEEFEAIGGLTPAPTAMKSNVPFQCEYTHHLQIETAIESKMGDVIICPFLSIA